MNDLINFEPTATYNKDDFIKLITKIERNADEHRLKIGEILDTIGPMLTSMTDFLIVAPIIKDYLKTSVENDANLIKLAAIAHKLIEENTKSEISQPSVEDLLSEDEKIQLYTLYAKPEDE